MDKVRLAVQKVEAPQDEVDVALDQHEGNLAAEDGCAQLVQRHPQRLVDETHVARRPYGEHLEQSPHPVGARVPSARGDDLLDVRRGVQLLPGLPRAQSEDLDGDVAVLSAAASRCQQRSLSAAGEGGGAEQ